MQIQVRQLVMICTVCHFLLVKNIEVVQLNRLCEFGSEKIKKGEFAPHLKLWIRLEIRFYHHETFENNSYSFSQ